MSLLGYENETQPIADRFGSVGRYCFLMAYVAEQQPKRARDTHDPETKSIIMRESSIIYAQLWELAEMARCAFGAYGGPAKRARDAWLEVAEIIGAEIHEDDVIFFEEDELADIESRLEGLEDAAMADARIRPIIGVSSEMRLIAPGGTA